MVHVVLSLVKNVMLLSKDISAILPEPRLCQTFQLVAHNGLNLPALIQNVKLEKSKLQLANVAQHLDKNVLLFTLADIAYLADKLILLQFQTVAHRRLHQFVILLLSLLLVMELHAALLLAKSVIQFINRNTVQLI